MNRVRVASFALGGAFGFLLSWGQFISPDRIRDMLLLRDSYMWVMFASAVAVAFVGMRLLRRARSRALLTGQPIAWTTMRPGRQHVTGAAIFGLGWAVSDVCPGPVAAQLGQGIGWSVLLLAGIGTGVLIALRRAEAPAARRTGARTARSRREAPAAQAAVAGPLPASAPE